MQIPWKCRHFKENENEVALSIRYSKMTIFCKDNIFDEKFGNEKYTYHILVKKNLGVILKIIAKSWQSLN